MFESLDETMKHDEQTESSPKERAVRYVMMAVAAVVILGGLLMGIRVLN
ncbi:MAG: hypothetical protein HYZ37_17190 [Candidatus Solibacter usitatus]|nr:hypothetical protein [Candidatus Solibacter usitatus]